MFSLTGNSKNIIDIKRLINRAAEYQLPVLITGECGTGKEVVARSIYSKKGSGEFVAVNCSAIPKELVESELFGYEKGAFTGANSNKKGKVEAAEKGVLFLDEIGELELSVQPKLLRLLQEMEYTPVGSTKIKKADFRLVCATNRDLHKMVKQGSFREDLFYRINGLTINVLPLRERVKDIPVLLELFLKKYSDIYNKKGLTFSEKTVRSLKEYDWPGNVRQLQTYVEREVCFADDKIISHIPDSMLISKRNKERTFDLKQIEKETIIRCMKKNKNNIKLSSELLGISRASLYRKIKEYDIEV
ncbi:MAG: Fis family transcriptional regulator [Candidatus Muiribacterium halophilum]|uniref:Fis family transcriptional regulator n=1 Tax=Muiribacterium halophilum TaxID=2053465 RepID=A0A2N5ZBE8_MUIH1|nr:MAG: Fis family transcriptional regulator [Candidatus Muirbacterium halophilum]